jgi:hypothetical protein
VPPSLIRRISWVDYVNWHRLPDAADFYLSNGEDRQHLAAELSFSKLFGTVEMWPKGRQ